VIYEIEGNFKEFRATPLNGFVVGLWLPRFQGYAPQWFCGCFFEKNIK
jgi:hypothetical protein